MKLDRKNIYIYMFHNCVIAHIRGQDTDRRKAQPTRDKCNGALIKWRLVVSVESADYWLVLSGWWDGTFVYCYFQLRAKYSPLNFP